MAHAQKPDLVFQWKGQVHLNWQGGQFNRLLAAEVCSSAVVMVVMLDTPCFEVECKTTGYPLHSHVSPSLPLPCVTMCHQVSTELYHDASVIIRNTFDWNLSRISILEFDADPHNCAPKVQIGFRMGLCTSSLNTKTLINVRHAQLFYL